MEKAVIISVKSRQEFEQAPTEKVELLTQGSLRFEDGVYTLSYQESQVTGMEGTQTTFQVERDGERVTLMRSGAYHSQMVFEEGRRHLSLYQTPYGSMTVGVHTWHLLAELDAQGGEIEIDYVIEVEHAAVGRNVFQIQIKEDTGTGGLRT